MPFDKTGLIAYGYGGTIQGVGLQLFNYTSNDTFDIIFASGYFDEVANKLQIGDLFTVLGELNTPSQWITIACVSSNVVPVVITEQIRRFESSLLIPDLSKPNKKFFMPIGADVVLLQICATSEGVLAPESTGNVTFDFKQGGAPITGVDSIVFDAGETVPGGVEMANVVADPQVKFSAGDVIEIDMTSLNINELSAIIVFTFRDVS